MMIHKHKRKDLDCWYSLFLFCVNIRSMERVERSSAYQSGHQLNDSMAEKCRTTNFLIFFLLHLLFSGSVRTIYCTHMFSLPFKHTFPITKLFPGSCFCTHFLPYALLVMQLIFLSQIFNSAGQTSKQSRVIQHCSAWVTLCILSYCFSYFNV